MKNVKFKQSLIDYFWVWVGFKNCFFGSTHLIEQLLFSMFCSILAFKFWVMFDILRPKWAIFGVGAWFKKCIGVYSFTSTTFIFYVLLIFNF